MLEEVCLQYNVGDIGKVGIAASRKWALRLENWRNLEQCRVTPLMNAGVVTI
jgi:hypothetical protein